MPASRGAGRHGTSKRDAGLRAAVIGVCRRLDARGLVAGAEGNVSARLGTRVLVTPAGARKGRLRARDLVSVTLNGVVARGEGVPSSELAVHLAVYRARPDVRAVVHAHPVAATAFAVARRPLPSDALAELTGVLGPVPLVRYSQPGSRKLAAAVARALRTADAALLANHGVVTVGTDLDKALNLMESLEQAARIVVSVHILGGVAPLNARQLRDLEAARTGNARPARTRRRT